MRSLRTRLILGIALVAIVPLGLALVLMSKRVESMVREESGLRLETGVHALQAEMRERQLRTEAKLSILSRDPLLRRLYLVRTSGVRELTDYLAERRILLDLDYLEVDALDSLPVATATGAPADSTLALKVDIASPISYDNRIVGTLRGGVLLDRDFLIRLQQRRGLDLLLFDRSGRLAASTLHDSLDHPTPPSVSRATIRSGTYWGLSAPLELGSTSATLTALTPTTPSDQTVAALRFTAVLLALGGLLVAILLGFLWSRQVSRPVERLAEHSRRLARGDWNEPISLHSVRELETLSEALDHMRADLVAYRDKLILSERHAAWSQMARKVAHEVKNPLTPIAISVSDLKRSYDLKRPDFPVVLDQAVRTISAEVDSLKRLLQEFSDFARFPAPTLAPVQAEALLDDLKALYVREIEEGHLAVAPVPSRITLNADAGQIRQALVNLVKNGLEAVNGSGKVTVEARPAGRSAEFTVTDTGPGLTAEQRAALFTPGFTTKVHGSGLGLTIVDRIVSEHGGTIAVQSGEGRGTTFVIRLPREGA